MAKRVVVKVDASGAGRVPYLVVPRWLKGAKAAVGNWSDRRVKSEYGKMVRWLWAQLRSLTKVCRHVPPSREREYKGAVKLVLGTLGRMVGCACGTPRKETERSMREGDRLIDALPL